MVISLCLLFCVWECSTSGSVFGDEQAEEGRHDGATDGLVEDFFWRFLRIMRSGNKVWLWLRFSVCTVSMPFDGFL